MPIQQKKLNFLITLRTDKKTRYSQGQVLIAGKKMVEEIARHYRLELFLYIEGEKPLPAKEKMGVTLDELKKITGLIEPEPIAAVVKLPAFCDLFSKNKLLILNRIQDPGNLGTLIRTALALGIEGVIITENTVDPFNDKALRAAKGATFFMPMAYLQEKELIPWLKKRALPTFVADLKGKDVEEIKANSFALILGSESLGPSDQIKEEFDSITIPIREVDSLNVAVAGSILMYALGKR